MNFPRSRPRARARHSRRRTPATAAKTTSPAFRRTRSRWSTINGCAAPAPAKDAPRSQTPPHRPTRWAQKTSGTRSRCRKPRATPPGRRRNLLADGRSSREARGSKHWQHEWRRDRQHKHKHQHGDDDDAAKRDTPELDARRHGLAAEACHSQEAQSKAPQAPQGPQTQTPRRQEQARQEQRTPQGRPASEARYGKARQAAQQRRLQAW